MAKTRVPSSSSSRSKGFLEPEVQVVHSWATSSQTLMTTINIGLDLKKYHLCKNDTAACTGGGGGEGTVVHLGKWRTWSEDELVHLTKEAGTMMNRFFKVPRKGEGERKRPAGGLPWSEGNLNLRKDRGKEGQNEKTPEEVKTKRQRISTLEN